MVQNLYCDRYCVILWLFHDWLRNSGSMIRFTSVAGSLCVITVAQAEQFSLVPGKKLCPQCYINLYKNKEQNYEPMDSVYQDDEAMKDQLNTSLTSLGCSPIKFAASTKQLSYGKRKIQEVNKTTEGYMANSLKVVSATFLLVCLKLKESTCETRKNVFYCTLKAFFILEIIKF